MGCVQSSAIQKQDEEKTNLRGAIFVFVPPLRAPSRSTELAKLGLRDGLLSPLMVEQMKALRSRIESMAMGDDAKPGGLYRKRSKSAITYHQQMQSFPQHAAATVTDLQLAIQEYLPFLLGLTDKDSRLREALSFSWIDFDNYYKEMQLGDAYYELLSMLHLMVILTLSQANLLLTPDPVNSGYQARVTDENKRASLDAFLKASGILKYTFDSVMNQMSEDLMEKLPPNLSKDTLSALYMQALAQGVEIQLSFAIDNPKATLAVKRRLACEQLKCWEQAKSKLQESSSFEDGHTWAQKHKLFIDWKHAEAKATAYYFHGLILCESADGGVVPDAAYCLQLADSLLSDSKKLCATFCSSSPASRVPPLTGSMKFLSEKIPKAATPKAQEQINQNEGPALPDFAIALQPEEFSLPPVDAEAWSSSNGITDTRQ